MDIIGVSTILKDFGITSIILEYTMDADSFGNSDNGIFNNVEYLNKDFKAIKCLLTPLHRKYFSFMEDYFTNYLNSLDELEGENGYGTIDFDLNAFYIRNEVTIEVLTYEKDTMEHTVDLY